MLRSSYLVLHKYSATPKANPLICFPSFRPLDEETSSREYLLSINVLLVIHVPGYVYMYGLFVIWDGYWDDLTDHNA